MKNVFFILLLLFVPSYVFAEEGKLSLGFGYPYFSVKYYPLELKYATGEGIDVFAGRFYWNFYPDTQKTTSVPVDEWVAGVGMSPILYGRKQKGTTRMRMGLHLI